jgi:hypothetical protein
MLWIDSHELLEFKNRATHLTREILVEECGLRFLQSRFEYLRYRWPLDFVFFEHTQTIGYFHPAFLQIGLNAHLRFLKNTEDLKQILRHELAHYFVLMDKTATVDSTPHGIPFQAVCERFGWGEDVKKASVAFTRSPEGYVLDHPSADSLPPHASLLNESELNLAQLQLQRQQAFEKVKKLLRLSESQSPFEAQLALQQAQKLILQFSLEEDLYSSQAKLYSTVLYSSAKQDAWMSCLYSLLTHFPVKPLVHAGKNRSELLVFGSREDLELAEYLFSQLQKQMNLLWQKSGLKGLRAKNSFLKGLAAGFLDHQQALQKCSSPGPTQVSGEKTFTTVEEKALLKKKHHQIEALFQLFRGTTRQSSSQGRIDQVALALGKASARDLQMRAGLKSPSTHNTKERGMLSLPWFS